MLEVQQINVKEMTEAGKKIREIFCMAYPDFERGLLSEEQILKCAQFMDEVYGNISSKARVFIISYSKLLENLLSGQHKNPLEDFRDIAGLVWDELEQKTREAHSKS